MTSFSAELYVAGYVLPLLRCSYGAQQATSQRGRPDARVRRSLVEGEAAVPDHELLATWAADPYKRYEATIIFYHAEADSVLETLHLPAAYCTGYAEHFVSGDTHDGAYCCRFTLAEPAGWVWYAGARPTPAASRPAAREHSRPVAPLALGGAALGGEAGVTEPFVVDAAGVPRLPPITGRPPFRVKGPANGKPGLDRAEFTRQLRGQQDGLNRLTVAEFLANRDRYLTRAMLTGDGRAAEGDAAQKAIRRIALRRKIDELTLENDTLTRNEARAQAQEWLDTQAALHDPDQVAGGHAHLITGLGDARVNYSIGAQWPKRIQGIDEHIRKHAAGMSQKERENTFLNVELPLV